MLAPRHQAFVDEYLKDLNASAAYERAGYTSTNPNVNSARLMAEPQIQAAIASALASRQKRVHLEADAILRELADLAMAPIDESLPASAKIRAIELAMKHLGIAGSDKVEVEVVDTLAERMAAARKRMGREPA